MAKINVRGKAEAKVKADSKSVVVEDFALPQFLSSTPKADKLAVPEIDKSAEIDIIWITE